MDEHRLQSLSVNVRLVNERIGNLTGHRVCKIEHGDGCISIRFANPSGAPEWFDVRIDGVLGFIDGGTVEQELTAGIVWCPVATYGLELARRVGIDPRVLLELRLDFEGTSGLVTRFNAVGRQICLDERPLMPNEPPMSPEKAPLHG